MAARHDRDTKPNSIDSVHVIQSYYARTGETFRAAVQRLHPTHTLAEAASALGFSSSHTLKYAVRSRGLTVRFADQGVDQ
ncbi:hypothetical protein D3C75_933290 [compost metagenome]